MKTHFIFPIATAVVGFAAGWLVKPSAPSQPTTEIATKTTERPAPKPVPTREDPEETAPETAQKSAPRSKPIGAPAVPAPTDHLLTRDETKMTRLAEALNLTPEQQQAILAALSKNNVLLNPESTNDLDVATRAASAISESLTSILTPEQITAFEAFRQRNRDNTLENTAQNRIAEISRLADLSAEQREQILGMIRGDLKTERQARPQGLDLVSDNSPLPLGPGFVSETAVDRLLFESQQLDSSSSELAFTELQRRNLETRLERYKSVLTPGQLTRLQADTDERKKTLDKVSEFLR